MITIIPREDDIFHCQVCNTRFTFNMMEDTEWETSISNTILSEGAKHNYLTCPVCGTKHTISEWALLQEG